MTCPTCGASMSLKEEAEFFSCEYCGNLVFPDLNADGVRVLELKAAESCSICAVSLVHAAVASHRIRYCERCRGMLLGMEVFVEVIQDLRARREGTVDAPHPPHWEELDRRLVCSSMRAGYGDASLRWSWKCGHRHVRGLFAQLAGLQRTRKNRAGAGSGLCFVDGQAKHVRTRVMSHNVQVVLAFDDLI